MAELRCLPETAAGFVHHPTGYRWRTAEFCPGCYILLNTACLRVLCGWKIRTELYRSVYEGERRHLLNMVNEEGTRVPEMGQCCRKGFWWSSLLLLLGRLKNDLCLGRREQIEI